MSDDDTGPEGITATFRASMKTSIATYNIKTGAIVFNKRLFC